MSAAPWTSGSITSAAISSRRPWITDSAASAADARQCLGPVGQRYA